MSEWVNEWAIGRMRAIHILIKQHTHTQTHIETHLISISISIGNSIYFYFHIFFYNQYSHTECGAVYGLFYFHFLCLFWLFVVFFSRHISFSRFVRVYVRVRVCVYFYWYVIVYLFIHFSLTRSHGAQFQNAIERMMIDLWMKWTAVI